MVDHERALKGPAMTSGKVVAVGFATYFITIPARLATPLFRSGYQ